MKQQNVHDEPIPDLFLKSMNNTRHVYSLRVGNSRCAGYNISRMVTAGSPTEVITRPCSDAVNRAKTLAAAFGFPLHGIARIPENGQAPGAASLGRWLARGLHGPLAYMQSSASQRQQPALRLPWARSVLVLGAFYDSAARGERGQDLEAHVARYARGRDYHLIFQRRLKKLSAALIEERICTKSHWHSDTGPFLERAWAEAAGLGWIGKNTCLIHPRLGSFFLLSEIFMDADLDGGEPESFHCGTCTRCMDACPTQALPEPGVLDAERCLVTWNIEKRGDTPSHFWQAQGEWAAGCDICQTVCPFNAPSRVPRPDPELAAPLPWQRMSLAECIMMDQSTFDQAFPASALRRTGLKGLRLGAITVAGNLKLMSCKDALKKAMEENDVEIRERAMWALQLCEICIER